MDSWPYRSITILVIVKYVNFYYSYLHVLLQLVVFLSLLRTNICQFSSFNDILNKK